MTHEFWTHIRHIHMTSHFSSWVRRNLNMHSEEAGQLDCFKQVRKAESPTKVSHHISMGNEDHQGCSQKNTDYLQLQ